MSLEYDDGNRGTIQHRERARQIIDFHGLKYGKITPTDIDGLIEYKDKLIIIIEMKYHDAELPYGQKIAIERLINNCEQANKTAIAFVCEHEQHDCEKDVNAAESKVREYFYKKKWYPGKRDTLKSKIDKVIAFVDELE